MTAAELRELLMRHEIRPIRGRSQHFLADTNVIRDIVAAATPKKGERIVEIGPGPGILTEALLDAEADVVAAEIDRKLCMVLRERFAGKRLRLVEGDALAVSNAEFSNGKPYAVVANLPYAITSAVFQKFLLESPKPTRMVVMIQKEVADRILAKAGEMSSLAVMVRTFASARRVRDVAPGAFIPPPAVRSSVIALDVRSPRALEAFFGEVTEARYFALVHAGFAAKRRQLQNSLMRIAPARTLAAAFDETGIAPSSRPEELLPEDWQRLAAAIGA